MFKLRCLAMNLLLITLAGSANAAPFFQSTSSASQTKSAELPPISNKVLTPAEYNSEISQMNAQDKTQFKQNLTQQINAIPNIPMPNTSKMMPLEAPKTEAQPEESTSKASETKTTTTTTTTDEASPASDETSTQDESTSAAPAKVPTPPPAPQNNSQPSSSGSKAYTGFAAPSNTGSTGSQSSGWKIKY